MNDKPYTSQIDKRGDKYDVVVAAKDRSIKFLDTFGSQEEAERAKEVWEHEVMRTIEDSIVIPPPNLLAR